MFKLKNSNDNVILGDSIEVNTYGYLAKGFVSNHFMTSKVIGTNETKIHSYILMEPNNKFVFFLPSDTVKTTRIVLTEKIKILPTLNQEINDKIFSAEKEFKDRQYIFKSRQIGRNSAFQQSLIYYSFFNKLKIE